MTVAQALQRELDKRGWTQEDAAMKLGVSRLSVNELLNGRRTLTAPMALRLEKVFKIDAESWLRLQMRMDLDDARSRRG